MKQVLLEALEEAHSASVELIKALEHKVGVHRDPLWTKATSEVAKMRIAFRELDTDFVVSFRNRVKTDLTYLYSPKII